MSMSHNAYGDFEWDYHECSYPDCKEMGYLSPSTNNHLCLEHWDELDGISPEETIDPEED